MSTTNIIGRKITGFEFPEIQSDLGVTLFLPEMTKYIGMIGEISRVDEEADEVHVDYPDGAVWAYPLSLIEQHLVPQSGGEGAEGPWSQGRLLDTYGTRHWSPESKVRTDYEERCQVFENFTSQDAGRSRKRIARCDTPEIAALIVKHKTDAEAYRVENERLRAVLERIAKWELPETGETSFNGHPLSYEACYGSNGARDYMRQLARAALSQNT